MVEQAASPTAAPAVSQSAGDRRADEQAPLLSRELGVETAGGEEEHLVKVLKDSRVLVGRKPYLIKAGEIFPFDSVKDGEVIFRANELRLSLPEDAVQMIEPSAGATAAVGPGKKAKRSGVASDAACAAGSGAPLSSARFERLA
jgi:hypothetical protein